MKEESGLVIKDYSKEILNATEYSGNNKKNQKEISASMIGSDYQQALLRYKYGTIQSDRIGQSEIGSLVHLGLSHVDFGDEVKCEYPVSTKYKDWTISGTIDRVDFENHIITDTKVTKTYTIQSILKDDAHTYRLQVNMYRILLKKLTGVDFDMQLEIFDKQGGYNYRKGETIPDLVYIPIEKIDDEVIFNRVDEIIEFVELGQEKQCDDIWLRKVGLRTIPTRCELYCSYKQVCSKYNPKPQTTIQGWNL